MNPKSTWRFPWRTLIVLVLLALAAAAFWNFRNNSDRPNYRTVPLERGNLRASVAASGTLNPVVSVQVGSQVSGQLKEVLVDFNSPVKKGQLIARIDPETFEYRLRQAQADVDTARAQALTQQAQVAAAQAAVSREQVNLEQAQRDLQRKESLVAKNFISPAERDTAKAAYDAQTQQFKAAQAQYDVAQAQARSSQATVRQREAQLAQSRVDLDHTEIRAPVDGIVIKKSVEPGQTVAASLQAPELFVIAKDLSDMQVEAAIDEADVGRIREGQNASFTVDAYPGRTYHAQVRQIRKAAQNTQNVITYNVVVSARNDDLQLLPGMTANVRIVTEQKQDVLKVPNAALRFQPPVPPGTANAGKASAAKQDRASSGEHGGNSGAGKGRMRAATQDKSRGKIYTLRDGQLAELPVTVGISDGRYTEVSGAGLTENLPVVIGTQDSSNDAAKNNRASAGPRMRL